MLDRGQGEGNSAGEGDQHNLLEGSVASSKFEPTKPPYQKAEKGNLVRLPESLDVRKWESGEREVGSVCVPLNY
jgi:hypothetical protein